MLENLIVFDIDDTITKSEFQHQLAYVNAMKHFGITDIDENWKNYLHHTDSYILKENYERNLNQKFRFSFIPSFEKIMTEHILELKTTDEISGAKVLIDKLIKENKYAFSFATGSLLQPAIIKLKQANINFDEALISSSNELFSREEIVNNAIEKAKQYYNVSSFKNIISVGDGIWDLKTARNLKLHFIGIGKKNLSDFQKENIGYHIYDWQGFDWGNMERVFGI